MSLDPIPDEMKNLKKLEKVLIIPKTILFKKKAIMHGKGEISKILEKHLQHSNRNWKFMQNFTKTSSFQWISCY